MFESAVWDSGQVREGRVCSLQRTWTWNGFHTQELHRAVLGFAFKLQYFDFPVSWLSFFWCSLLLYLVTGDFKKLMSIVDFQCYVNFFCKAK